MEEFMKQAFQELPKYIDPIYTLLFIFLSYTITNNFGSLLQKVTKFEWRTSYTVFTIATLLAVPFLIWTDSNWIKILFSYAAGTTLYEIAFKFIGKKIEDAVKKDN